MAESEGAEGTEESIEFKGEYDAERAAKALAASRQDTKDAKDKAAETIKAMEKELSGFRAVEDEKAESEKAAEVKLAEANATIVRLNGEADGRIVRDSFIAAASGRGYNDPVLAYVAAQAQGALGELAKDGSVGDHDFEALEASHTSFATEAGVEGRQANGDAATKGGTSAKTQSERFNEEIRSAF